MSGMENFFAELLEAATAQEAIDLGLLFIARELTSEELLALTNEGSLKSDAVAGLTWGMVNSNNIRGIVYCRHATRLADPHHRKYGADYSVA